MTTLPPRTARGTPKTEALLRNLTIVFALVWVLGLFTSYTLGGWIYALPVLAGMMFLGRLFLRDNQRVIS